MRPVRLLAAVLLAALAIVSAGAGEATAAASRSGIPADPAPAPAPSVPAPPAAVSTSSIPVPEVAQRAEEVGKQLRDFEAPFANEAGLAAIEQRLPDLGDRLSARATETTDLLQAQPTATTLDGLTAQWQTARAELATYIHVLAERATALETTIKRLAGLRDTWTRARADARASRAPGPVVDRIDATLSSIAHTRTSLEQLRTRILVLQDRVAQHVVQCDEILLRITVSRADVKGWLTVRDGVPLWRREYLAELLTGLPERVRRAVAADLAELEQFVVDHERRIAALVAFLLVLALLLSLARRTAARLGAHGTLAVLERPLATALMLAFLVAAFTTPRSRVARAVGEMMMLVPTLRIVRLGLAPRRLRLLNPLAVVFVVDFIRRLAAPVPALEQEVFLIEAGAVIAWLASRLLRGRQSDPGRAPWDRSLPTMVGLAAFGVAAAFDVAGYVRLAVFIGSGILGSVFLALVLDASLRVAGALVALGFETRPLRDLLMVQRHRPFLERRTLGLLRGLAVIGWVILVLRHLGVWHSSLGLLGAALSAELRPGALSVSVGAVLVFALTVATTMVLSRMILFVLREELYPRWAPERVLPYAVGTLVQFVLLTAGVLLGLAALGVDLTKVTIVAGALGVGIGFGLQGLVNNFVSGLVVLYERRINVGDAIQVKDVAGEVQQLGIRACTIRTWEGAEVIVPNASLVSESVANWTLSDRVRRIDLPVGVAYGTPPEKVAETLLAVARAHPRVLAHPAPVVVLMGFEESVLRFEMRVWTDRFERWFETRSELAVSGYAALREAGIEIPFPQREVRLRGD